MHKGDYKLQVVKMLFSQWQDSDRLFW